MSTEATTYWVKKSTRAVDPKSSRAIQPIILARKINEDWLHSSVDVTHYQFTGALQSALTDLLEASPKKTRTGTNLPTNSLRLMLQIGLQDVLRVDRHLGCKSPSQGDVSFAIEALGGVEEDGHTTVAKILVEWCMSSLEPWSVDKGCEAIAMRVKNAAVAKNIIATQSKVPLRDARTGSLKFALISRLLAEQLRGQSLFDGLGACELVLPGPFGDTFDLITSPRTLAATGPTQSPQIFSMLARVQVSTMPCSKSAYVSISPAKRVWANAPPTGGNTGRRTTAYAFPPDSNSPDALRAVVPFLVEKRTAAESYRWEFNDDEYAVIHQQAGLSKTTPPVSLDSAIREGTRDSQRWWVGLPQTTRLYGRVSQHTPTDTDEFDLMKKCSTLLQGFADENISFTLRDLPLNKSSMTTMIKSEDCGAAGAALVDDGADDEDDSEDVSAETTAARDEQIAAFRSQCVRVLKAVHGDTRPTLWLLGGTPEETGIATKIVEHLFGDYVTLRLDPLPDDVHNLRLNLPGADLPSKQRFNLRVDKWKDLKNPKGLLNAISAHTGPKFVLVCAGKEINNRPEDGVNRRAAIHAICSHTGAAVHHVLPMESGNTPARQARARQNFIHRLQSAMTDVMLAHSGHIIDASKFAIDRIPDGCKFVYGIQALRKNAQRFSGETPVCMFIHSRINLDTDTTEVQFRYGRGSQIAKSQWQPLSEGLIWLAGQRDINSDERWLKANFEELTRDFLIETQQTDPNAVVLLDWGTLSGLWKALADERLTLEAPTLGNLPLKTAFPLMSFVRIRYGIKAQISVRGRRTSYYEAFRYGNATSKELTNLYRDDYVTSTKQLVEIKECSGQPGSYQASHFIGMMTPRKTSQSKRGLSSFRSVTLMNKVSREKGADTIYERTLRAPESKDNSSPGPMDISVLQHPPSISAVDLAVLSMGLRLGYPHYDEWTQLPAPLFFIRKIDDYIIKYPDEQEAQNADQDEAPEAIANEYSVGDATDDALESLDSQTQASVIPAFDLVSKMVQKELGFEDAAVNEDAPDVTDPRASASTEADPPSQSISSADSQPPSGAEQESPSKIAPDLSMAQDAAGQLDDTKLLAMAQGIDYIPLIPFSGKEGLRKRKLFSSMIRGDISLSVEVPYFVNLERIYADYPKPEKKSINRFWAKLREESLVRTSSAQPSNFSGWLGKMMRHPQGAYITNARQLFGKTLIIPASDRLVNRHNADPANEDKKIYINDTELDLSALTQACCDQKDDDALGWLVFTAAQCPALGIADTVIKKLSCIPGPMTKSALAYYVQCALAIEQGLAQVSNALNLNIGNFRGIGLKRPDEFAYPPEPPEPVISPIAKAVQDTLANVLSDPFLCTDAQDPDQVDCGPDCETELQPTPPVLQAPEFNKISDPVMKIKSDINKLLHSLEPGKESFTTDVAEIRLLLEEMEQIDASRKEQAVKAGEMAALCAKAYAKAQAILDRIIRLDDDDIVMARSYRPVEMTPDILDSVELDLDLLDSSIQKAEDKTKTLLEQETDPSMTKAEKLHKLKVITKLSIEINNLVLEIKQQVENSDAYTNDGQDNDPDDGPGGKDTAHAELIEPNNDLPTRSSDEHLSESTEVATAQSQDDSLAPIDTDIEQSVVTTPTQTPDPVVQVDAQPEEAPQKTQAPCAPELVEAAAVVTSQALEPQATAPEKAVSTPTIEMPYSPSADNNAATSAVVQATEDCDEERETACAVVEQTPLPVAQSAKKKMLNEATAAGADAALEKSLLKLKELIELRHFGLADVYIDAIEAAFDTQKDSGGPNFQLLHALTAELESVDCNSMVQPRFNQWQSSIFKGAAADSIPLAIGMLGAGLSGAIFYDPANSGNDPLWSVIQSVDAKLQDKPSLNALIDHLASREKTAVTLSQSKLVQSFASSEERITAELESQRKRAQNWRHDPIMHTKWSHTGFARAHDYIYSPDSSIGKCMALVVKDDVKGLKKALADCQGKFKKPKSTVQDAFHKIKDRTEINGGYLVHAVNNLEVTESFLRGYIDLSEQKDVGGKSHALRNHERNYITDLHIRLKDAADEIDEIIANGTSWTAIELIYLQSGKGLIQAVIRLFDDQKGDACISSDIQRLLIQQPMSRDLTPSFKESVGGVDKTPVLFQPAELIESINNLLAEDLGNHPYPISKEAMDRLLADAQEVHIANKRFLPAWRIEALLNRPKSKNSTDTQPSLINQYNRAKDELRIQLQTLRQRVTHAMSLNALAQKEANDMLHAIASIEAVLKQHHIGKPDCPSPTLPDFPHAYFVINERVTKPLDRRMDAATERLQDALQSLRDRKGSEVHRDADRIERMLATKKPADLRAAHDAIRLIEAGQKLPTHEPQRTQETTKHFLDTINLLHKLPRQKESLLDGLINALKATPGEDDSPLIKELNEVQRLEAAAFVENWIEMCTLRGNEAAQKASELFSSLDLGAPAYAPEQTSRGSAPARMEFPPNPFIRLSSECFIPPQLGSLQQHLLAYVVHGTRPENDISTIISEQANNPVVIMARTTIAPSKRLRTVGKGAAVILIEDYLIAFMALNPNERAQKLLEIGLLTFQVNPYSAEGAHVAREMFFGRQNELSTLRNVKNAAILYGGRRLGKSSLLAQIERDENRTATPRAFYIPMNKDYQGGDHVVFAWQTIYEHLIASGMIESVKPSPTSAQAYVNQIQKGLLNSATGIKHCYLLLDEADELMSAELDMANGQGGFVRSLQNMSESLVALGFTLRYCIAGLHNLARMTTEVNSALGKAETIALEPFTTDEDIMRGIELITRPMAALGFYFDADAGDLPLRIMSVCNFYPAFIQIYCQKLLSYMNNKRTDDQSTWHIKLNDIDRVETDHDLLADLSKKFSMTLDLDTRYKAIALVLADHYYAEIEGGTDEGATLQDIREMCEAGVGTHFQNINTSIFESLLDEMRKLNVIEKTGNKYRLRNPGIAMLLGDKERIGSQIADLASLTPSKLRNHGEQRSQLQHNEHTKTKDLPIFPMPSSWVHSMFGGQRELDGSLPILCGNHLSGLQEISIPKMAGRLTQNDHFFCYPGTATDTRSYLNTKIGRTVIPQTKNGKLLLMSSSTGWGKSDITSDITGFINMASRKPIPNIQFALAAAPPRMWEMVCTARAQIKRNGTNLLNTWNVVPVPTYSQDALRFHLADNRAVADNKTACEDILYATCGFGRLVQKNCNDSLTVEKAAGLRHEAETGFANSLDTFYEEVGLNNVIDTGHLRRIEAALNYINGEQRTPSLLDDVNEMTQDAFAGQNDIDQLDLLFMQWMGLLREGENNTWLVPPLYARLIKH
jgi:hypothetical protein